MSKNNNDDKEAMYKEACLLMDSGKYYVARNEFGKIRGYKNATVLEEKCRAVLYGIEAAETITEKTNNIVEKIDNRGTRYEIAWQNRNWELCDQIKKEIIAENNHGANQNALITILKKTGTSSNDGRIIVDLIENKNIVFELAWKCGDWELQKQLIAQVNDENLLINVAKEIDHSASFFLRIAAIEQIKNENVLTEIAKNDVDPNIRGAAVKQISDETVLIEIADNDCALCVYNAAVERITDKTVLEKIIREKKKLYDTNRKLPDNCNWHAGQVSFINSIYDVDYVHKVDYFNPWIFKELLIIYLKEIKGLKLTSTKSNHYVFLNGNFYNIKFKIKIDKTWSKIGQRITIESPFSDLSLFCDFLDVIEDFLVGWQEIVSDKKYADLIYKNTPVNTKNGFIPGADIKFYMDDMGIDLYNADGIIIDSVACISNYYGKETQDMIQALIEQGKTSNLPDVKPMVKTLEARRSKE